MAPSRRFARRRAGCKSFPLVERSPIAARGACDNSPYSSYPVRDSSCESHVPEKDDPRTDAELVAAINGGDWSAFDTLYHRHRDWVFRLAWRFAGSEIDAHDALQETFAYLAKKLRAGLELRAGITTLLYPAVKHTALAIRRKRQRQQSLDEEIPLPAPPAGDDPAAARPRLAAALTGVSDAHREVLLMRFVDDMTLEEIAVALAIPLGTAKSRLHHALKFLRDDECLRRVLEE
jgi:RNA polymerase sigma-70 factor, ECF subfamily